MGVCITAGSVIGASFAGEQWQFLIPSRPFLERENLVTNNYLAGCKLIPNDLSDYGLGNVGLMIYTTSTRKLGLRSRVENPNNTA